MARWAATLLCVTALAGCATLGQLQSLLLPLRFGQAEGRPPELRLGGISRAQPLGGANVRIWMRVENPNPFGVTLSTLQATLRLDDRHAAEGDFPLGLPLGASADSIIPIDLTIDFRDVPGLAAVVRSVGTGDRVPYELEGTVGIDAGRFGRPTFGPMSLVRGEIGGLQRISPVRSP